VRGLKDALDLGMGGLIVPMTESSFGGFKFASEVESMFGTHKLFKSIDLETRESANQIDRILGVAQGKIDNITIGRTGLSQSYFDREKLNLILLLFLISLGV
jgi:2-keto-3-deoxy-L-rhamnonate aldolase RhmA